MAEKVKDYEYTKMVAKKFAQLAFMARFPRLNLLALRIMSPLMRKQTWYNDPFRYVWVGSGEGRKSVTSLKGARWGIEAMAEYMQSHVDAVLNNEPTVWVEWDISPGVIMALDMTPVTPEWPVLFPNVKRSHYVPDILQAVEAEGVTEDLCSAARAAIAATLMEQLPRPVAIITSTQPCDSVQSAYQVLARETGVPMFCLGLPYHRQKEDFQYFTENIRHMISFLEEKTGKKMDYNRLRSVLEESNKTNHYLSEVCEMNRAIPCPSSLLDLIIIWPFNVCYLGNPKLTEFARYIYEDTKKRFKEGIPGGPNPEKIRVVWHDVPIAFMPVITWMEKMFGAYVVADMVGYNNMPPIDTTNEETMTRGIAEQYMNLTMGRHFHGTIDLYLGEIDRFVEEYSPDCLIFTLHRGCKQSWAIRNIMKQKAKEHGLPVLIIEADIFDYRYKTEQQVKDQIEDFLISSGLSV
ncbi:MAG: 2-hydroxyacyl-CoA dehydratase family protein [Thermodesulfobacteriota bacterium]|nr:2-hydroxyacyl-CoA dehydratase family protein [Thermodesulfobacteriota bacterium]